MLPFPLVFEMLEVFRKRIAHPAFFGVDMRKILIIAVSLLLIFLTGAVFRVQAATFTTSGIANYLPISDSNVQDGDIVSFSPQGYRLSHIPYDPLIVGVVTDHPAISLETNGPKKSYPVISSGQVDVLVSDANGAIKKGDAITTSSAPGVGMRATKSGFVIGAALKDFSPATPHAQGKIPVTLDSHYLAVKGSINSSLFDILNLSTLATYEEPLQVFRYVIAAAVLLLSFVFGFFIFSRGVNKGIEALGRNPLAGRMIQLGIIFNTIITVVIVGAGIFIAYLVLRL